MVRGLRRLIFGRLRIIFGSILNEYDVKILIEKPYNQIENYMHENAGRIYMQITYGWLYQVNFWYFLYHTVFLHVLPTLVTNSYRLVKMARYLFQFWRGPYDLFKGHIETYILLLALYSELNSSKFRYEHYGIEKQRSHT